MWQLCLVGYFSGGIAVGQCTLAGQPFVIFQAALVAVPGFGGGKGAKIIEALLHYYPAGSAASFAATSMHPVDALPLNGSQQRLPRIYPNLEAAEVLHS